MGVARKLWGDEKEEVGKEGTSNGGITNGVDGKETPTQSQATTAWKPYYLENFLVRCQLMYSRCRLNLEIRGNSLKEDR